MRILLISTIMMALSSMALAETVLVSVDPIEIDLDNPVQVCDPLRWTAPDEREDGSDLPSTEIKSYTIFAGTTSGEYTRQVEVVDATEVPCSAFEITEYVDHYFAGITTDTNGLKSQLSNEITRTAEDLKPSPSPPKRFFFSGEIVIQ